MRVLKWSRNFLKVNYDRERWHGAHWRHRWVEGQRDENLMKRREQPRTGRHSQNQTFIAFELLQVGLVCFAPLTTSITNHIKFPSGTSETRGSRGSSERRILRFNLRSHLSFELLTRVVWKSRKRKEERKKALPRKWTKERTTNARHWDSKGNKRRRRLYYCAGNKRIQEDPIDFYMSKGT